MEYVVEVTLNARQPLTEAALMSVAGIGGTAVGNPGQKRLETTLTVKAIDVRQAAVKAVEAVTNKVAGIVLAVEAMTTDEADRRDAQRGALVGVTEVGRMLGISKQRVSTLSKRGDFPAPLVKLVSGPVWRAGDLSRFAGTWKRKAGRPKHVAEEPVITQREMPPIPPICRTR